MAQIMEKVSEEVVYRTENIRLVYYPELECMMMYQQDKPSVQEYKDAFLALVPLFHAHPWKVSGSHELDLQQIPPAARLWVSTTFLTRPDVRRLARQTQGIIAVKAHSSVGRLLAHIFHTMLYRLTGMEVKEFDTVTDAFAYLQSRMAQKPRPSKGRSQVLL